MRGEARYYRYAAIAGAAVLLEGTLRLGWRVPTLALTTCASAAAIEYAADLLRGKRSAKTWWVMGPLFACVLPPGVPLWTAAVGMAFAVVAGVEVFGGSYLFSPVLLGRYFLTLSYPSLVTGSYLSAAGTLTRETPLELARAGDVLPLKTLLSGASAGSLGESMAIAVMLGALALLVTRAVDWRVVLAALVPFGLGAMLLMDEPPGWHLLAGGMLFAAIFLAADPVIAPSARWGRVVYGALIGVSALVLRRFGSGVEDVTLAVLAGNLLVPFVNRTFAHKVKE